MTVDVVVERTGASVLAVLQEVSPAEAEAFESEFRAALIRATESLDLAEAQHVLTHWWGIVQLRLHPLSDDEIELIGRFHAGEDVGWSTPAEYRAAKHA